MNLEIFNAPDPTGKMSRESFILKNYLLEYNYIIQFSVDNNLIDIPFKQKIYHTINNIKSIVLCKNPNCGNFVNYKNSTLGYNDYCSNKCISSDPNIKKIKEEKSYAKFGTKTPGESLIVKNKMIKTNNARYGANSPMLNIDIQNKSKETLIKNWGVDNPAKNIILLGKRINSFKDNIEQYKDSYQKTSIERYGVDHPWMNKEIHSKTIDFFYKEYKERIENKIINKNVDFLRFKKEESTSVLEFFCKDCNSNFNIFPYQFYGRINQSQPLCTKCFPILDSSSVDQLQLLKFITDNYSDEIIPNVKNIIFPYEIDVFLPKLKIGFEFNGVFWHSDKFKDKDYHLKKYNCSIKNDIKIYTIWEDDWITKNEICKSFILNKIGISNKIMARKCNIKEIDYMTSKSFLDENHLQKDCKSSIRLGLFYHDELVSLMTFSKSRILLSSINSEDKCELTRFCNKNNTSVIGGASKLLSYFIKNYNPNKIETYSDNLISSGDLYKKLGFRFEHTTNPGYWYVINGIREHRFNWRKQILVDMGYDANKTEEEIMMENGFYRIYNAGNKKWIWNKIT